MRIWGGFGVFAGERNKGGGDGQLSGWRWSLAGDLAWGRDPGRKGGAG